MGAPMGVGMNSYLFHDFPSRVSQQMPCNGVTRLQKAGAARRIPGCGAGESFALSGAACGPCPESHVAQTTASRYSRTRVSCDEPSGETTAAVRGR